MNQLDVVLHPESDSPWIKICVLLPLQLQFWAEPPCSRHNTLLSSGLPHQPRMLLRPLTLCQVPCCLLVPQPLCLFCNPFFCGVSGSGFRRITKLVIITKSRIDRGIRTSSTIILRMRAGG